VLPSRDALIHAISFALIRCRTYFPMLVKTHNTDEARTAVTAIIAGQIERSGLEVRQRPPNRGHSTP
jgi:hypothetical protein